MTDTTYYKILNNGQSESSPKCTWSLPQDKSPGDWMPNVVGKLSSNRGYHLCAGIGQLLDWLMNGNEIYEAEYQGDVRQVGRKFLVRSCRLTKKTAWDENAARQFAADCAEHVLSIVNSKVPHHVACDLADAVAAARNPSEDDSKNVFVDLATALVSATLSETPSGAVRVNVCSATGVGHSAAGLVAAWAVSRAETAARDAECKWQARRLCNYLEGKT